MQPVEAVCIRLLTPLLLLCLLWSVFQPATACDWSISFQVEEGSSLGDYTGGNIIHSEADVNQLQSQLIQRVLCMQHYEDDRATQAHSLHPIAPISERSVRMSNQVALHVTCAWQMVL